MTEKERLFVGSRHIFTSFMQGHPDSKWATMYHRFDFNEKMSYTFFCRLCVKYQIPRFFAGEPEAPEPREVHKRKNYDAAFKRYEKRLEKGPQPPKPRVTEWMAYYDDSLSIIQGHLSKYPDSTYEDLEETLVKREFKGQKLIHFHSYLVEDNLGNQREVVKPFSFLPTKSLLKKLCKERNLTLPKRSRHFVHFDRYLPLAASLLLSGSSYKETATIISGFYSGLPTYMGLYLWMKRNGLVKKKKRKV